MSQSTPTRHSFWLSILLTLLCLAAAGAGGYALYRDLTDSGQGGSGPALAQLTRTEARVKRKFSSSFLWSPIESGSSLYKKDSIKTELGGAALLKLLDGTELELGEETLYTIDSVKDLSLGFVKGTAVIRTEKGISQISVNNEGKATVETLSIRLIAPAAGLHITHKDNEQVKVLFRWATQQASPNPPDLTLQISPEKSFKSSQTQKIALTTETSKTLYLSNGKFYWRITSNSKPLTETRFFLISPPPAPLLAPAPIEPPRLQITEAPVPTRSAAPSPSPSPSAPPLLRAPATLTSTPESRYNPVKNKKELTLTWEPVPESASYELTIRKGETEILKQKLDKPVFAIRKLPEGALTWSVQPIDRAGKKGIESLRKPIEIQIGSPLKAPELVSPEVQ